MPQTEIEDTAAVKASTHAFQITIDACLQTCSRITGQLHHISDVFDGEEYANAEQVQAETTKAVAYLNSLNAIEGLIRGLGRTR